MTKSVAVGTCLLSGSLVLAVHGDAWAEPPSANAADALFESAREAMARGDYATACPRFAESQRLDPAPGTLLNLAQCEEKAGKLATSSAHVSEALAALPKDDFRIAYAQERLAALKPRVPTVTLSVSAAAPRVRVFQDDLELREASFGVPLPLDPGQHVYVVRAPGYADGREEVTLTEGTITLRLGPILGAPAAGGESGESRSQRGLAYGALGLGATGVVTGVVTGLMYASARSTYRDRCDPTGCDEEGLGAASRAKTFDVVSPIAFAVGAAGLGVGTYLLLRKPTPRQGAVKLGPRVGWESAGLMVSGGF